MSVTRFIKYLTVSGNLRVGLLGLLLAGTPAISSAELVWSGDFETGDFLQWPNSLEFGSSYYAGIPQYCRPQKVDGENGAHPDTYYGDGSCLEVVTSPVRQGKYAAKFTVKNSVNGSEADRRDCDGSPTSAKCERRRTELWMHKGMPTHFNGMPYMGETWSSISHFVPEDWDSSGSGFGPLVFQIKPLNEYGLSPTVSIELGRKGWKINHRWSPDPDMERSELLWQWTMFYAADEGGAPYPREDFWPDGLADFPNVQDSYDALKSVNKGGWTDWVFHIKFDARGSGQGGTGFLELWKREDSGPWVQVLNILPKKTTRGGITFDHGVGYNAPPNGTNPGGFGPIAGMYMGKEQVWGLPDNRVIYIDNVKVGSATATFEDMSPDESTTTEDPAPTTSRPKPPKLVSVD